MRRFAAVLLSVIILLCASACKTVPVSEPSSSTVLNSAPSDILSSLPSSDPLSSEADSSVTEPSSSQIVSRPQAEPQPVPTPTPTPSVHSEHYCYSSLSDLQKQYYDAMHTAVHDMHSSWIVLGPHTKNYVSDIAIVRNALASDHPDVFWLPPYYVTAKGTDDGGNPAALIMFSSSADISPSYLVKRSEKAYMEEELRDAVEAITAQVSSADPFEIELQLHDLLCARVEYSDDETDPMIYTAYGALVNGRALCEGYSRAMQLLLSEFGIPCVTVTGVAHGEGHMWNAVNLFGQWYHLDATWNDTKSGFISHEYFNITDEVISLDHSFAKDYAELDPSALVDGTVSFNIARPLCLGAEYNFFSKKGFTYSPENTTELAIYLVESPSDIVEVKFSDVGFRNAFFENYNDYLEGINQELALLDPAASFYINRISVSSTVLKLYKNQRAADSGL